jgi:hypothetical protein
MHTATAIISTSSWPGATSARRCPASGTSPRRPEPPPGRRPESGTPCPRCCRRPRAGRRRDAELTGLLDLAGNGWPKGMRVIARRERPHPGAQLRITDVDGHRVRHEHPHRRARHPAARPRAAPPPPRRCEDRIRCAKDTGLASLPLHDFAQNQIWCAVVALACEITAWMQTLALHGHPARQWEPKRLRLRLLSAAGHLAASGRTTTLHLGSHARWTALALQALQTSCCSQPATGSAASPGRT